jgi:hypothetical protein
MAVPQRDREVRHVGEYVFCEQPDHFYSPTFTRQPVAPIARSVKDEVEYHKDQCSDRSTWYAIK